MHRFKVFGMMSIAVLCTACSTTKLLPLEEQSRKDGEIIVPRPTNGALTQNQKIADKVVFGVKCRLFKNEARMETRKLDLPKTSPRCRIGFVGLRSPTL